MQKHILFLRPIIKQDLEKIILNGPYGPGIDISNGKFYFGRLEIQYIYGLELDLNGLDGFGGFGGLDPHHIPVKGLESYTPRQIDVDIFYSIVEYIGSVQISSYKLTNS